MWTFTGDILSFKYHLPFRRMYHAGDQIEEGTFTCSVRTDKTQHLPFIDIDVNSGNGGQAAKILCEPCYFKNLLLLLALFFFYKMQLLIRVCLQDHCET